MFVSEGMASALTAVKSVKGPANEYFYDLEEACDAYLCRLFSDWKITDRTYMFPPTFPFRYTGPTGVASGAVRLSKSEEVDVKGDEAELRIFRALDKFGREDNQPMFVLTKFEFKEFIKEVLSRKLPVESVDSLFASLSETDLSREIDFLVVHKRVGVILIEVKATEKFRTNRYLDAKKQLEVGEKFIQALLKAMGITLPVYKVIAMPNVADPGRDSAGYIDLRKHHLVVDDDDSVDVQLFSRWWKEHFSETSLGEVGDAMMLTFMSVLVGQRAAISATANILEEVCKTIDEQRFLERSYVKLSKKAAHGSETVVKSTTKASLATLAKQFMFLNREQLDVWEGPLHQVITGSAGSGKTILLQFKALECAQRNEKVIVVVPTPLDKLYTEFFTRNGITNSTTVVITFQQLADFLRKAEEEVTGPLHVFVDEFPVLFVERNQQLQDSFWDFLARHHCDNCYQWIAEDSEQLVLRDRFESFEGKQRTEVDTIQVSTFGSLLCKDQGFRNSSELMTTMRYTNEIYNYLNQHYYQHSPVINLTFDASNFDDIKFDNTFSRIRIGHHICGPEVIEERRTFETSKERLEHCMHIIKGELSEWLKVEEGECCYCKVAILVEVPEWIDELSSPMKEQRIPVCSIGDVRNAVVLDCGDRALSFEWPIVIAICQSKRNFVAISRAIARLRILWWQQSTP